MFRIVKFVALFLIIYSSAVGQSNYGFELLGRALPGDERQMSYKGGQA